MLAPLKLQEIEQSLAELAAMSPEVREQWLSRFNTPQALEMLRFHWDFWGRPSQFPPDSDWSNWLILAGRGFGKTRTGAEWVRANMCGPTPLTGLTKQFMDAGAIFLPAGCGPCAGGVGAPLGPGEVSISTAATNGSGRMGSREAECYLASPVTVTASAIAGRIVDPRHSLPVEKV